MAGVFLTDGASNDNVSSASEVFHANDGVGSGLPGQPDFAAISMLHGTQCGSGFVPSHLGGGIVKGPSSGPSIYDGCFTDDYPEISIKRARPNDYAGVPKSVEVDAYRRQHEICVMIRLVQERFLMMVDEEYPIWGPLQREVAAHPQADQIIGTNEELIKFLQLFFTPTVIENLNSILKWTEDSWLGGQYAKRGVYSSYVNNMIFDINHCVRRFRGAAGESSTETADREGTADRQGSALNEDSGQDWKVVPPKRGKAQGQGPVRGGGSGGDGPGGFGDGYQGRLKFRRAVIEIVLEPWLTPEKKVNPSIPERVYRSTSIRRRSLLFMQDAAVRAAVPEYDAMKMDYEDDTYVYLFHGTRSSNLQNFQQKGISPANKENEYSLHPSFYVTNSLRNAFEHPMHNHPHLHNLTQQECDSVTVICFKVPVGVLLGRSSPQGNDEFFSVQLFDGADDIWKEFVHHNWTAGRGSQKIYRSYDITIGPISMPRINATGERDYGVVFVDGRMPYQLAFSSPLARLWLAHHVDLIFKEVRKAL